MDLKGQQLIDSINIKKLRTVSDFKVGDFVKVFTKIEDGNKKRIQIFEGLVISRKGSLISETFTVRKVYSGVGVERTFPIHSPSYEKVEVIRRGIVKRAKLYYVRNLSNKAIRIKENKIK
ncbi:MAG: 50S ribosomal protein L19 [Candidatus Phytoplasma stylosanthis]|uniref:50S ribosomal protein L19 n=1 Tax=Candidatus Phytoplasma stylosanthis TaxID=2798314 RepID=UPI00293B2BA4|nr:50S ribosomal protein L19 [Candidatus Phytoplasma stylosanthis]MDV3168146.1 50S ribosomal protein L19 [Candidatus Phytoplasma stylosanthis]MDV3170714.1 50S ribosomal protein L19 [Candidatus Phytoplasma stylosanthis]MDV3173837.1 50S ribosomal protein L19 [Candidatus Phytoplasma stylosanthis]MDV3173971.1 50S ribosomal protein L19 [Candidatus Phytoplasma stylosanthis]MDV3196045.1 50S ribosomal protein L19 [Candidatus Phytoplasma stylosanthis]